MWVQIGPYSDAGASEWSDLGFKCSVGDKSAWGIWLACIRSCDFFTSVVKRYDWQPRARERMLRMPFRRPFASVTDGAMEETSEGVLERG